MSKYLEVNLVTKFNTQFYIFLIYFRIKKFIKCTVQVCGKKYAVYCFFYHKANK